MSVFGQLDCGKGAHAKGSLLLVDLDDLKVLEGELIVGVLD